MARSLLNAVMLNAVMLNAVIGGHNAKDRMTARQV
jgi:hypothetical protein